MSVDLEDLLARLARLPSPVLADRLLARTLAAQPCLLGPAQQALDRLRGHAGAARNVEHLQGGWWRVAGGLERVTEAAAGDVPRARAHLAGLAGAPGPLWIDPPVHVPAALLRVAWEAARITPLAIARPGRLVVGAYAFGLDLHGPDVGGRTLTEVELHGAGPPVVGTLVEVDWGEPAATLAHELGHAAGADEREARQIAALWR